MHRNSGPARQPRQKKAGTKAFKPRVTLPRALSKLGVCSRSQGVIAVKQGKVRVNDRVCTNPDTWVDMDRDRIELDNTALREKKKVYLALNKPRGLVTTRADEKGRATVYDCFEGVNFGWISPVGRLDAASEGLLLFTNDNQWANHLTDPAHHVEKIYHVQIEPRPSPNQLHQMILGVCIPGESTPWSVLSCHLLTDRDQGEKRAWIEVILDEGKNRQIRRILESLQFQVHRLVRVQIGNLPLGDLAKGQYRELTSAEISGLARKRQANSPAPVFQRPEQK